MESEYSKYEPIFGSWYIKNLIGKGSIGEVYLIERKESNYTYRSALKVISIPQERDEIKTLKTNQMSDDDISAYYKTLMDNISEELTAMAKLKGQSNIVSYEDHMMIPHEDGVGWDILIRMELLTPLVDYCQDNVLSEDDVIKMGLDISRGLELCSQNGIVHRDIKPENIFISPAGDFKLGDFGVSRMVEETRAGLSRKGTFTYMAPEVFAGKAYGHGADIYSLGLVMYKFLNGGRDAFMPPSPKPITFEDTERAFLKRISGSSMPELTCENKRLADIVMKACAFSPEERFSSANEMRIALEKLPYDELPLEEPKKKKKFVLPLIITLSVILILALVYFMIPKEVEDITGISGEETVLYGDTLSPEYMVEPKRFSDEKITFESGDGDVFTVDENGKITATGLGTATLTMSCKGYSEDTVITVEKKITKIKGIKNRYTLTEGNSVRLNPKLVPEKYSDEKVTYKSSDKNIATVSDKGKITAKNAGNCTVAISSGGYVKEIDITVEKKPEPVVYVENNNVSNGSSSSKSKSTKKKEKKETFYPEDDEYF